MLEHPWHFQVVGKTDDDHAESDEAVVLPDVVNPSMRQAWMTPRRAHWSQADVVVSREGLARRREEDKVELSGSHAMQDVALHVSAVEVLSHSIVINFPRRNLRSPLA